MYHDREVNEIIACITVSLFATEICTDITNETRGKALSLCPRFLSTYKLLSFAMLFQGSILSSLCFSQNSPSISLLTACLWASWKSFLQTQEFLRLSTTDVQGRSQQLSSPVAAAQHWSMPTWSDAKITPLKGWHLG